MSGKHEIYIGVVIPTYNERENIVRLIDNIRRILDGLRFKHIILVVDDNSPDGTAKIVEEYSRKAGNVIVMVRTGKLGIGSAVRDGMKKLISEYNVTHIVTMDADFSHDPKDLPKLLKHLNEADVIIGSRYVSKGKIIGWNFYRRLISWGANKIVKILYKTKIHDHTGNYRIYSRRAVEAIVKYSTMNGYEWMIEALLIITALGYKTLEVPITFINRTKGKSKLKIRDIIRWFISITSYRKRFKKIKEAANLAIIKT